MKAIKELVISARDDCLVWRVDTDGDYAKLVEINVDDGCYGVMYFNGRKYRAFPTGLYNFEWRMYEKNSGKITVAAASVNGIVKLPFGAGRVAYEFSDGASELGVNGTCAVKLVYSKALPEDRRYAACDKLQAAYAGKEKIGTAEIGEKWRNKLSNVVKSTLAEAVAARAGLSRAELNAAFDKEIKPLIIAEINKLAGELADEGLEIDDLVIDRLFISESDAPAPKLAAEPQDEKPKENEADEPTEETEEDDVSEEELEATEEPCDEEQPKDEDTRAERESPVEEKPSEEKPKAVATGVKCGVCGSENVEGAKFCKHCGAALLREKDDGLVECPTCKKRLERGTKFCKYCGTKLPAEGETFCPTCKKPTEPGAKFCKYCGTKL